MEYPEWYDTRPTLRPISKSTHKRDKFSFDFHVTDISQIDWAKVGEDLSYSKPMAFLEVRGKHYVICHRTLGNKSIHSNTPLFSDITYAEIDFIVGLNIFSGTLKEQRHRWVEWAKTVKRAKWPENMREGGLVNVTVPSI